MTRRYTQVPISAGREEHFGLAGEDLAFGADDVDVYRVLFSQIVFLPGVCAGYISELRIFAKRVSSARSASLK